MATTTATTTATRGRGRDRDAFSRACASRWRQRWASSRTRGVEGRRACAPAAAAAASSARVDVWTDVQLPFDDETSAKFMQGYWQKKPLLIRGAIRDFKAPLDGNEIAGAACEEDSSARLFVRRGDDDASWEKQLGPFSEEDLISLPTDRPWSLIVNDLDVQVEPIGDLLELFNCFPRWRIADIQASVSPDGGGVGPHTDHFDVFLLQAEGEKRWSVASNEAYWPDNDDAFVPDCAIRVLKEFTEDDSFVLVPGDMLYLPPKVAHNGVAVNSAPGVSVTLSIGFLAPTIDELILSYTSQATEKVKGSRWSDPWLKPVEDIGAISAESVSVASEMLKRTYPKNDAEVARWFGCHVTARTGDEFDEEDSGVSVEELLGEWEHSALVAREDLRFAFIDEVDDGSLENALFFANGECWDIASDAALKTARIISNRGELYEEDTQTEACDFDEEALALVLKLFERGYIYFREEEEV